MRTKIFIFMLFALIFLTGCAGGDALETSDPKQPENSEKSEKSEETVLPTPPQIAGALPDEYQTGEFWRRVEYSGDLLSLPDGETPESYFEQIQIHAESEAGRYIREDRIPYEEEWQLDYGGDAGRDGGAFFEDFRIQYLTPGGVYAKDGIRYLVYTLRYQLKAVPGSRLVLAGGMEQSIDGWMSVGLNSVLALTLEEDGTIKLCFGAQSDIFPDNEEFFEEEFGVLLEENQQK